MPNQPGAQPRGLAPPCCSAVPVPTVALWELRTAGTGTSVPIPMYIGIGTCGASPLPPAPSRTELHVRTRIN